MNLITATNLSVNKRYLYKQGVVDESGRLTSTGSSFLLKRYLNENEQEIVDEIKALEAEDAKTVTPTDK